MPNYGTTKLTPKEQKIVQLVSEGLTNKEIAQILGITRYVAANYLRPIFDKLGVWTRLELALWYLKKERENVRTSVNRRCRTFLSNFNS